MTTAASHQGHVQNHPVVSDHEWLDARRALLEKEKRLTRLRDEVSRERRALPWQRVDRDYVFVAPSDRVSLDDLFEDRSQLIVYHFMFGPTWTEGCKSCSFWMDNLSGAVVHLKHRDTTVVAVSRAPLAQLEAFKQRMGWTFTWVSSSECDFNYDYGVSFTPEQTASDEALYNFGTSRFPEEEAPGISVFIRAEDGHIYHTYSCYARGLDAVNGAYQLLDLTPKGRDEDGLRYTMEWLRHHDRY